MVLHSATGCYSWKAGVIRAGREVISRTLQEDREELGLSRTPEDDPTRFEGTTPWGWASLMVMRARWGQKLNAEAEAEAPADQTAVEL